MVTGRGEKLVPSPTRVPLRVAGPGSKESDRAFARVATKAARSRAASARRKAAPLRGVVSKTGAVKGGKRKAVIAANKQDFGRGVNNIRNSVTRTNPPVPLAVRARPKLMAANNIAKFNLDGAPFPGSKMRKLRGDSKAKLKQYTRRIMRLIRNTSQSQQQQRSFEVSRNVAKGYVTTRQIKANAKAQKTEATAQKALKE